MVDPKLLEYIDKLHQEKLAAIVEKLELKFKSQEIKHTSADISLIGADLAKAQGEFKVARKNKINPYFKSSYADLEAIFECSRPALTKYGISVIQDIYTYPTGENFIITILIHKSGQFIESRIRLNPPKNDIQSISSHITYMKRIAYSSIAGIVTGDEDDDGEAAVSTERETFAKGTALNHNFNNTYESITPEQREELEYELSHHPDITEKVLSAYRINSIADIPKSKFMTAITRIREIKNERNGIR